MLMIIITKTTKNSKYIMNNVQITNQITKASILQYIRINVEIIASMEIQLA
jgi:hypothetical protein